MLFPSYFFATRRLEQNNDGSLHSQMMLYLELLAVEVSLHVVLGCTFVSEALF
jgi:hypothetical protein